MEPAPPPTAPAALRRGALFWAAPEEPDEHAPSVPHPHVVVQDDLFNRSRIATVVVCGLTSNPKRATEPGNVWLDAGEGGLQKPSVVVVSQISSIPKRSLGAYIGQLSEDRMEQVLAGLRFLQRGYFGDR